MTAFKQVTIAVLGADSAGQKSLAAALMQALAAMPTSSQPRRWHITVDTPLQRLLERVQTPASRPDGAGLDIESAEFQDALAQQRRFDHSLLLGLDVTPAALVLTPQIIDEQRRLDTLLRRSLTQANLPFQVIYGQGDEQLGQALAALSAPPTTTSRPRKPWVWACDKCSDSDCEHRLLSDLLASRQSPKD